MKKEPDRGKVMFRVEKFIPTECPKCQQLFLKEGQDYARLLGDIKAGRKMIRETTGYDIITCKKCKNFTARVMIEACQVSDRENSEVLLTKGFVNLQEVEAFGNLTEDAHEVFTSMPGLQVRSLENF